MSAKKDVRTCVICGETKLKASGVFGRTARQVACKGECLKAYEVIVRAKRSTVILPPMTPKVPKYDMTELDSCLSPIAYSLCRKTWK